MTNYTFNTPQPVALEIKSIAGDVKVRATTTNITSVNVSGRYADEMIVTQTGATITIRSPHADGLDGLFLGGLIRRHRRIDITVEVPVGSDLALSLGAGDTSITGPFGRVEVRPGAGCVHLGQAAGETIVHLGAGSITVDTITGSARLVTGAGSIKVGDVVGDAQLQVATGEIDINTIAGAVRAKTSAGSLHAGTVAGDLTAEMSVGGATIDRISAGHLTFKGTSGGVKVGVVAGTPTWTDLSTMTGRVVNNLPSVGQPAPGQNHVELRISTVSGGIELNPV